MRWRDLDLAEPLPDVFFSVPRTVHFVGVGGIGMSALAFAMKDRGHRVSGSDANDGPMLARLREKGIDTFVGHRADNLHSQSGGVDAVIKSSAISEQNCELQEATRLHISLWHRAQLLADIVNRARTSIAISGTHGKSTTSAMVAHILAETGRNPTALLGAEYSPFGSNVRLGSPDLVVAEADESDGSFTLLHSTVAVVLNVEAEHLENYDDNVEELWRAFDVFAKKARNAVVINADDGGLLHRWGSMSNGATYGVEASGTALSAIERSTANGVVAFELIAHGTSIGQFELGVPGRHNLSNALAAILAVFLGVGVPFSEAARAVASFHGVKRRFERIGEVDDVLVYSDYGHHPTEVARTLETARDFLRRPIVAIFQPHRYSRTQQLGRDFGGAFDAADQIIITELYSAFEDPIPGVNGTIVFDAVKEQNPGKVIRYVSDLEEASAVALSLARPGDAVICLGAGDIGALPARLVECLAERRQPADPGSATPPTTWAGSFQRNESLARHCTIKVGGCGAWWLEPATEVELAHDLEQIRRIGMPLQVFGAGSNIIPGDNGFDGAVIKLGSGFAWHHIEREILTTGGAMLLPKLTHLALDAGLGNLEWACGVPGTVGASVWGNAGARGFNGREFESRDCAADLQSVGAIGMDGRRHELSRNEISFGYRESSLEGLIVVSAAFKLKVLPGTEVEKHRNAVKELLRLRRESQPASAASAGCIWKNPTQKNAGSAGSLIERCGLKGARVAGAEISPLHANFIVNTGSATGADVRALAELVESSVLRQTGIALQREARFL